MSSNCPLQVIEYVDPTPLIAVACPVCREVALYDTPEAAARIAVSHGLACHSTTIIIAELLPAADDTWTARAHN